VKFNLPDDLRASHDVPPDVRDELLRRASRLSGFAQRVHWLDTASSTNDLAARLADLGAEEGTVVVAESQTAGRGRMGRVWFSPPGAGLYVSIVLRPAIDPSALLTLAAGVALAEGVELSTGLPAEIKWPNDLIVGKRKLAGILAEAAAQGGALRFVVLGFGLNVRPAAYPPELSDRATSIEAELGRPVDRAVILAELLAALATRYADLQQGRFDAILNSWRQRAVSLRGSLVEWNSPAGVQRGRAEDIDGSGALLVRVDGRTERLIAGEVTWI
jgi:BirA family biotin operon repressor/biotin-[acetyl-CoA-carboxylase] ligase